MTEQDILDQVVAHLRTQNQKSLNAINQCVYRAKGGPPAR